MSLIQTNTDSKFQSRFYPAGVEFNNISVVFNGKKTLDNVSAHVPTGSATVILGPNGAGKTTLLRCILKEYNYTGKINFFNENNRPIDTPVIGYVPQVLQIDSQSPLQVYEFMALGHEKRPLWLGLGKKSRKIAEEFLNLVGAEHLLNRRMGQLSGGEMRRVLLASALSRKPGLLILDEAEAGVDYKGERLFWELLDKSRREFGFTLLMVSHNLPLAAHYATYALCIKERLLAEGSPRKILTGKLLQELFGVPIHLYPDQCEEDRSSCPDCGAMGNLPHIEK